MGRVEWGKPRASPMAAIEMFGAPQGQGRAAFPLWLASSIVRQEGRAKKEGSRNEEYPFGLLRITASGVWTLESGPDSLEAAVAPPTIMHGNKETQNEVARLRSASARCVDNSCFVCLSRRWARTVYGLRHRDRNDAECKSEGEKRHHRNEQVHLAVATE